MRHSGLLMEERRSKLSQFDKRSAAPFTAPSARAGIVAAQGVQQLAFTGRRKFNPLRLGPRRAWSESERPLQGDEFRAADVAFGSAAPVRDYRMQPFGRALVAVVGRHARTTAVASNSHLLDGLGEGPNRTGRSPRKPPLAPMGRPATTGRAISPAHSRHSRCTARQRTFAAITGRPRADLRQRPLQGSSAGGVTLVRPNLSWAAFASGGRAR